MALCVLCGDPLSSPAFWLPPFFHRRPAVSAVYVPPVRPSWARSEPGYGEASLCVCARMRPFQGRQTVFLEPFAMHRALHVFGFTRFPHDQSVQGVVALVHVHPPLRQRFFNAPKFYLPTLASRFSGVLPRDGRRLGECFLLCNSEIDGGGFRL